MTSRSQRLGLEPGSELQTSVLEQPDHLEIAHSIAISLMGLRIAAERIADRLDDIASGTATLNCDVRQQ